MLRRMEDNDSFAEDLPANIAVQYRVLQKMLSGCRREHRHVGVGVTPFIDDRCVPTRGSGKWTPESGFVPIMAPTSLAGGQRATICRELPRGKVISCEENVDSVLQEIEHGDPIIGQLREMCVSHARLCVLLGELRQGFWRALFESEARERRLIEESATFVFDVVLSLLHENPLKQFSFCVHHAREAEAREVQLQQRIEELWKRNEHLENLLMTVEVGQLLHEEQLKRPKRDEGIIRWELHKARKTIATLQQKLRGEAISREQLLSLVGDLEALKLQYAELVSAHTNGRAVVDRYATEVDVSVTKSEALNAEMEDLRCPSSERDVPIKLLHHELEELHDVDHQLGSSQLKVNKLERWSNATAVINGSVDDW